MSIRLKTRYELGALPHAEHPMPQAMREDWLNLNGEWDFCKIDAAGNRSHEGKIIVPFSPETVNSGIGEGFVLERGAKLRYFRTVTVDKSLLQGTTLLHFGAVDSACEVYLNGTLVGTHRGGFTPFTLNVSDHIKKGENTVGSLPLPIPDFLNPCCLALRLRHHPSFPVWTVPLFSRHSAFMRST